MFDNGHCRPESIRADTQDRGVPGSHHPCRIGEHVRPPFEHETHDTKRGLTSRHMPPVVVNTGHFDITQVGGVTPHA